MKKLLQRQYFDKTNSDIFFSVKEMFDYLFGVTVPWKVTKLDRNSTTLEWENIQNFLETLLQFGCPIPVANNLWVFTPLQFENFKNIIEWRANEVNDQFTLPNVSKSIQLSTNSPYGNEQE